MSGKAFSGSISTFTIIGDAATRRIARRSPRSHTSTGISRRSTADASIAQAMAVLGVSRPTLRAIEALTSLLRRRPALRAQLRTAGTSPAERKHLIAALAAGTPMLIIGTHALLEADIEIPGLGLAIVDEQHRFGVKQRATLTHSDGRRPRTTLAACPRRTFRRSSFPVSWHGPSRWSIAV